MTHMPAVEPVDCEDVKEALAGRLPLSPGARAHADRCPICALPTTPASYAAPSAELLSAVEADVARDQGIAGRLRSLPTRERLFVAAAWAALLVTSTALSMPRAAYGPVPVARVVLVVTVLATLLAATLRLGLRPLHAAPARRSAVLTTFALGLLVPFGFAVLPLAAPAVTADSARAMLSCFTLGLVPGALIVLSLRWLDRLGHGSRDAVLLAAAAGGLTGNAILELHCPITAPSHLVLAHATVGLALAATCAALHAARRA